MKSRVLLITSIYPPQVGGPAIFTSRFSGWLFEKNFKVKITTYTKDKPIKYEKPDQALRRAISSQIQRNDPIDLTLVNRGNCNCVEFS